MKKVTFLSVIVALILVSCSSNSGFKVSKSGLKYKIVPGKGGDSLKVGDIVQYNIIQKFGDSVVRNSEESGNGFAKLDPEDQPFAETEVIKMMRLGDSAMIKISTDSIYKFIFKQAQQQQPGIDKVKFENDMPTKFFLKKGEYVTVGIKVLKKYTSDSLARVDFDAQKPKMMAYQEKMQKKMQEEQAKKDEVGNAKSAKEFEKLIKEKGATWKKTPSGAYVELLTNGTGEPVVVGKIAEVRYTGSLISTNGVFDSNIKGAKKGDTATKPLLPVSIGGGQAQGAMSVIKGLDEGLQLLSKGAKANVYMPSALGYGGQGQSDELPAYSNLKFYIEVENVKVPAAAPKQPAGPQGGQQLTPEQMQQLQQMQQQQAAPKQ